MLIETVAEQVWTEVYEYRMIHGPSSEPEVSIYMSIEFFMDCKYEIKGEVSNAVLEFSEGDTIMGYPVFKVVPSEVGQDNPKLKHSPVKIVIQG